MGEDRNADSEDDEEGEDSDEERRQEDSGEEGEAPIPTKCSA